jgi:heme exporter protein C
MCLLTGSLWGRPMWGTYWVWDARLTSVLVLFLMYLGVIALWRAIDDPTRAARATAVLTLVGAMNLPIIKFSVDWWNTLLQGASVSRLGGSTIHPAILVPLIVMLIAFTLLFVALQLASMRPLFPCGSEAASRPLDGRSGSVRPTMFHPASRRGSACDRADSP